MSSTAMALSSAATDWTSISFENSTKREANSRAITEWRKTRTTHIDMLIGNYLSHYFEVLANSIRTGAAQFRMPRRSDGMRFYDRCLPNTIPLKPGPPYLDGLDRITPRGRWDWFVFGNETALFWASMQPAVKRVLDHTLRACDLRAAVKAPVLHFRCASAPLNRHSQYRFMRYSFFRAAARRYRRRFKEPLKRLHLLTCVADDVLRPGQARLCTSYLDDLARFLRDDMGIEVHISNCAHSMFEDFAIMYYAPFLISTGSTMSLMPGLARHVRRGTFVSPLLFDEASLASNGRSPGRRVGCSSCEWMLQRDHSLCHCEVVSYADDGKVIGLLRESSTLQHVKPRPNAPPEQRLCPRCDQVRCDVFRPIACEIQAPSVWRGVAPPVEEHAAPASQPASPSPLSPSAPSSSVPLPPPSAGRTLAIRAPNCKAVNAAPMSESECKEAASKPGFGRKWIGSGTERSEAPGCVLWEEGNVEYNRYAPPLEEQRCNVRGTCLCKDNAGGGTERQLIGSAV